MHESRMRSRGIVAVERTPEWNVKRKVSGIVLLVAGVLCLFLFSAALSAKSNSGHSSSAPQTGFWLREDGTPMSREEARSMGLPDDLPNK